MMMNNLAIRAIFKQWKAGQSISPEAMQHIDAARRAESEKHFDIAVAEYRKVTELEPTVAAGFVSLGQALMEKNDYPAATVPLKHAVE